MSNSLVTPWTAAHQAPLSVEFPSQESQCGIYSSALFKSLGFYVGVASLVAQMVKRLPAMQETWVQSLGQKDPLEKEMATHSSTLA